MAISKLSLASFNLYNLNLPGLRMYRDANGWSQEEYDKKIDWTARILREGQTDVWGLQEHWHNDALTEAVTRAGLEATHTLLMPPGHAGQKIQCAALVKSDILVGAPEWITDFPEAFLLKSSGEDEQTPSISLDVKAFSRPVLTFKIKPARSKDEIRVFVCHFKSKAPTRVDTENWYDRNEDLYKPHRTALGAAISTIRRTATFMLDGRASEGSDRGLYSVATMLQLRSERDVYYSHIYKNRMETLDHILVSEELYDLSMCILD